MIKIIDNFGLINLDSIVKHIKYLIFLNSKFVSFCSSTECSVTILVPDIFVRSFTIV